MSAATGWLGAGVGLVALGAAGQAAPSLSSVWALRRSLTPGLAGLGAPDHVALTFDDGPDLSSTPSFLAELDRLGWHATFFMLGDMVRRAPGLAAEVAAAGHEIAVHGDQHISMLRRSPWSADTDVRRARDVIADATGVEPRWFRPPYGTLSGSAVWAAHRAGLRTVLWTAWGRDWRPEATAKTVTDDVLEGHLEGGTVLLHDSDIASSPGSWHAGIGALSLLADAFAVRGLRVGTLGEHDLRFRHRASSRFFSTNKRQKSGV